MVSRYHATTGPPGSQQHHHHHQQGSSSGAPGNHVVGHGKEQHMHLHHHHHPHHCLVAHCPPGPQQANTSQQHAAAMTQFRLIAAAAGRADVSFGGYAAQAHAVHGHGHSQASAPGSVSGTASGNMRQSMHHPQQPPQNQQQSPAPTSTPPGVPPQHGDLSKQGPPPPHMQGQQPPISSNTHGSIHLNYIQHHRNPYMQRQQLNTRITGHRMPGNNMSAQQYQVAAHSNVYQSPNLMTANMGSQPAVLATPIFSQPYGGFYYEAEASWSGRYRYRRNSVSPIRGQQTSAASSQDQQTHSQDEMQDIGPQAWERPNIWEYDGGTDSETAYTETNRPVTPCLRCLRDISPQTYAKWEMGRHIWEHSDATTTETACPETNRPVTPYLRDTSPQAWERPNICEHDGATDRDLDELQHEGHYIYGYDMGQASRSSQGAHLMTPEGHYFYGYDMDQASRSSQGAYFITSEGIVYGYWDIEEANSSSQGAHFMPSEQYATPTRGNSPGVQNYFSANHQYMYQMPFNQHQTNMPQMYFSNQVAMVRPGLLGQQQPQQPQQQQQQHQNAGHVGAPQAPAQASNSGIPGQGVGGPQPHLMQEKRRRPHAISIVNPETGKDVLDEICSEGGSSNSTAPTPPRSGESSARQTPQPATVPSENNIAAEFAAKVAIAAGEDSLGRATETRYPVLSVSPGVQVNGPGQSADSQKQQSKRDAGVRLQSSESWKASPQTDTSEKQSKNLDVPHEESEVKEEIQVDTSSPQLRSSEKSASPSDSPNGELDHEGKGSQWKQAKGRSNKQQREMMNKRGADKEGTDMDAFVESQEGAASNVDEKQAVPVTPAAAVPTAPVSPVDKLETTETCAASAVNSQAKGDAPFLPAKEEVSEDIASAEDKLVAARNEENTRASSETVTQPASNSSAVIEKCPDLSIKLVYNKDQWSPQNLEGKKKYERDFLLKLKDDPKSMKRPEDLPKLEVVINDNYKNRSSDPRPLTALNRAGGNPDNLLLPTFMNSRNSLTKNSSQKGKPKTPKVIQLNLSLNEEVKLNETENAWRPARLQKGAEEIDSTHEELYKKVRSVLNKLTPQKFDLLVDQVKTLPIDTKEKLEEVINLVFEKAVDEPNFSVAYAMMCQTLSGMQVPAKKIDSKDGKPISESVQFKKLLISKCQVEFEKQSLSEKDMLRREERLKEIEAVEGLEKKKELEMQLEEEERRVRMKYVGVNRFIGELYKRQMLTGGIMVQCITKLLEANDEESLECLCKLLTTIGKELETRFEKDKKQVDLANHFQRMQEIVNKRNTSSRIRFMLQDVIELRADNWKPRRGDSNPKTMDEIAKEAERESLNQLATPPHQIRSNKDDRDRDRKKGRPGVGDDGWHIAGGRLSASRSGPVDSSKLKEVKRADIDVGGVYLGSKSQFSTWCKGASGHKAKQDLIASPGTNQFSVLSSDLEKPGLEKSFMNIPSHMGGTQQSMAEARKFMPAAAIPAGAAEVSMVQPAAELPSFPMRGPSSADSPVMPEEIPLPKDLSPSSSSNKGPEMLSEADLYNKAKLLIHEYLSEENIQDFIQCVQEEIHPKQINNMLSTWLQLCMEWSMPRRLKTANGLMQLYQKKIISNEHLMPVLDEILSIADDLLIDIPMTYRYLADLIVPLLRSEALLFSHLQATLKKFKGTGGAAKFLVELMKLLQKDKGPGWIVAQWKASDMSWSEYVAPDKVEQFLTENSLTYFMNKTNEGDEFDTSVPKEVMSYDEMQQRLVTLMPQSSYDDVVQWIAVNIGKEIKNPKYVRALMTAICEFGTCGEENQQKLNPVLFNQYNNLIHRYVDNTEELELQALFAIQAYVHRLEHPPGLLTSILSNLLEEGVLSKDSIQAWTKSEDPAETTGRGVALKSINQFIAWLDEPDYDSCES